MTKITGPLQKYGQLIFAIVYALVCLMPSIWIGDQGGPVFSIYRLPAINVLQIMIYPVFMLLLFGFGLTSSTASGWQSPLGALISLVNLVFLFMLPISLNRQIGIGWLSAAFRGQKVIMRTGYYLLYSLTIIYLMLFFVQWRLSSSKAKEKDAAEAEQQPKIEDDDDWRPY